MKLELMNLNGEKVKDLTLNDSIFKIEVNDDALKKMIRLQLDATRQGTRKTKNRSEVSGGGRKPWKQKGTGRARAGSTRSPLFAGGGVIFGPKPRNYDLAMPQKARKLALKSALSAREAQLVVVKDFSAITEPKTKLVVSALKSLEVSGKVLLVADTNAPENKNISLAGRNIPTLKMILPTNLNVKDLLEADYVIITESAVNDITERLQ